MKNQVKTFRLFVRDDEKSQQIADKIRILNQNSSKPLSESDNPDLVIAIGGDGTFIDAVTSTNFSKDIIYTGIHTGTLGFLQDLCENDIFSLIQYINFEQELKTRKVYIASIDVFLKDSKTSHFFALNDIIVAGDNYSKIRFEERFEEDNGEDYLQTVTGNGIILATNTGDTAYSANAGGAIDLTNNFHLARTLITPIRNAAYESFLPNPIFTSKINITLHPANNISIIIDGKRKDIDSSSIKSVEVSAQKSNFINKLDLMNYSKVRVIREKILGY